MYRNKLVDGLLKHISEKVVGNTMRYYLEDVAFNVAYMTDQSNMHLVPSFTDRKRKQFYCSILRVLPEDYVEHGLKALNKRSVQPGTLS